MREHEIPMFETDGRFDRMAVAVMGQSFIDRGLSAEKTPADKLCTKFLPVKP